jgi:hypothetical protein
MRFTRRALALWGKVGVSCSGMQDGTVYLRPQIMPISKEAIPGALAKAERYRFINEPLQAESICRDVLAADPTNTAARIMLILSLTDQFEHGVNTKEALQMVELLPTEYQEIRPPDNDDSVLRWNACVRFLERNWGFQ